MSEGEAGGVRREMYAGWIREGREIMKIINNNLTKKYAVVKKNSNRK